MNWRNAIIFLTILNLFNHVQLIVGEIFEECEGVAPGTFVSSNSDCAVYIYCDVDDESASGTCPDGQYFDGESCDEMENVYCPLDIDSEPEGPVPEDSNESQEVPTTTTQTTTTTTTSATTTTTQTTTTTTNPTTISSTATTIDALTIPPIVRDSCPMTDDPSQIILMANGNSCTDYYLCYHGQAIEMHCTDHLHFNSNTGKCDFPENVHCLNDRPNANKCLPHITDFFPHPGNCNYFYYCIKGFMTVQQCPFYYGWDIEKRSCVHISQAKCYSSAKRNTH